MTFGVFQECGRERQKQRLLQLQLEEAQETLRHAEELMKVRPPPPPPPAPDWD